MQDLPDVKRKRRDLLRNSAALAGVLRGGFVVDDRPDAKGTRCMTTCK